MLAPRLLGFGLALVLAIFVSAPMQWLLRRTSFDRTADILQMGIARLLCRTLRLSVDVHGTLAPVRPAMIVANHVSWTDILVLGAQAPLCFIAKADVANWPLLGWAVRAHGTLFVARRRTRGIQDANRLISQAMAAGRVIVLFAEGTTGHGRRLEPFRSGHLQAANLLLAREPTIPAVTLVPAAVAYTRLGGLPVDAQDRAGLAWVGDMRLLPHLLHLLRHGPIRCGLAWGAPLRFQRGDDRKTAMAELRRRIHGDFAGLIAGQRRQNPVFHAAAAVWSPDTMPSATPRAHSGPHR